MDDQDRTPTEGPREEDDLSGKRPVLDNSSDLPVVNQEPEDVAQQADDISELMTDAADSVEPVEAAPDDLPEAPAVPFDDTVDDAPDSDIGHSTDFLEAPEFDPGLGPAEADIGVDAPDKEVPAPPEEDIKAIQDNLQAFGDKVEAFNEAGGVYGGGGSESYGGTGGEGGLSDPQGPLGEFAQATDDFVKGSFEFLRDHARSINDTLRQLECERL